MRHYSELEHEFEHYLDNTKETTLHASEIAYLLRKIRKEESKEKFLEVLEKIPPEVFGDVLIELPEDAKDEAIEHFPSIKLAGAVESLESDDAADLVQDIEDVDEEKAEILLTHLDEDDRQDIDTLNRYEEDQAGAWMQTELFDATLDESVQNSIDRLKTLKEADELENVHRVFIVNSDRRLIATIALEDIILFDFTKTYRELISKKEVRSVEATEDIEHVASIFEQYDLSVLPVVDYQGRLVGRITSDDIYDVIEERATEQIYNLAGVNDDAENEEKLWGVFKKRSSWLGVNLLTAILASIVISFFDETLAAIVPLAILMPIVASMGGNAGTQTLTVMVRKMALGDIDRVNAQDALKKELYVSLLNGLLFSVLMGVIAYIWFGMQMLGIVIALAMVINLFIAGLFGATVPLMLKRLNVDPAVGSTVILTTATDVFGFLSFLGLASLLLV